MSILDKQLRVFMSDGTVWDVPVFAIADNRTCFYNTDYCSMSHSEVFKDTVRLFEECERKVIDWATNLMDWAEAVDDAVMVQDSMFKDESTYQEDWVHGDKKVVE